MDNRFENIGLYLAISGAVVSCYGVIQLNILMNPLAAIHVWSVSNLILLVWAVGLWRKWWDGGLSGLALCGMYGFYTVANIWGMLHV